MSAHPPERLNRFLARRGVASRRGADALIASGRVTVNGDVSPLGVIVDPSRDRVCVDGYRIPAKAVAVTIVLNKPVGVVTTRSDPYQRRTVMDLIEPVPGLVPVGRLDADSRGLLVMTTDGDLAHAVSHPRHGVTKRYVATLDAPVSAGQLAQIVAGVELEDGTARALSAKRGGSDSSVEVVMAEGRKREVRRLFAAVGLEVRDLVRIAVGPLLLGDLAEGEARELRPAELSSLRAAAGLPAPPRQPATPRSRRSR
ncbi:MAG TPA: pseudouridine synthase [Candidatus Saccharimonadales bacterium]|nr:pseudouridine synthase [Candidatus Saccharimonadales bacterium]